MLSDVKIQEAIAECHNANIQKACISAQRVLLELSRLCTSNPRNLFDENGKLIPIKALPNEVAATVSSIEVVQKGGAHIQCHQCGARQEVRERVVKVKQWDKNVALTNMAKHFGLLRDLMEVTGKNGGPIQIETCQIPIERLSIEDRRMMLEILERNQLAIGQGNDGDSGDNINDTVDAEYVESTDRDKSGNERLTAAMPLYYSPDEE